MDWLNQLDLEEIRTTIGRDMGMVIQECGLDAAKALWAKLSGINIYVSERDLNELRRVFVRRFYKADDPRFDRKGLAILLGVSEEFVRKAREADNKDDRSGDLFES